MWHSNSIANSIDNDYFLCYILNQVNFQFWATLMDKVINSELFKIWCVIPYLWSIVLTFTPSEKKLINISSNAGLNNVCDVCRLEATHSHRILKQHYNVGHFSRIHTREKLNICWYHTFLTHIFTGILASLSKLLKREGRAGQGIYINRYTYQSCWNVFLRGSAGGG